MDVLELCCEESRSIVILPSIFLIRESSGRRYYIIYATLQSDG